MRYDSLLKLLVFYKEENFSDKTSKGKPDLTCSLTRAALFKLSELASLKFVELNIFPYH